MTKLGDGLSNALRMHVFVCTNERENGHPRGSCGRKESLDILGKLKRKAREAGLNDVRVNKSGCLNRCESGPACVVYPEGTWYSLPHDEEGLSSILKHLAVGNVSEEHVLVEE